MKKGFSILELWAIIICSGLALHSVNEKPQITMAAITSQVRYVEGSAGNYLDANRYLEQVGHELQKVNEG